MDILICCTRFPPDSAIASVRPYMFAKYLTRIGHSVVVIRSGEISSNPDDTYPVDESGFEVFSYLGEDCAAERFRRGEATAIKRGKSRISFLPRGPRKIIAKIFHKLNSPKELYDTFKKAKKNFEKQKVLIDELKRKSRRFDVVFATYGGLENIYSGEYASQIWNCKYILDLRDPIAQKSFYTFIEYEIMRLFQRNAILKSDICTVVSEELANTIREYIPGKTIVTIYNGYEPSVLKYSDIKTLSGKLSFCYTGQLYGNKSDASSLFRIIGELVREGIILKKNIIFKYAGYNFDTLKEQASKYNVDDILENCGYLNRLEIQKLQRECDIFVVLSWNYKDEHGVLTGKFYEGIRCKRPILALVSGTDSGSELSLMQKKYNYGLCIEEAKGEDGLQELKEWIKNSYLLKMSNHELNYTANERFAMDFRYDTLAGQLNQIISLLFD